MIKVMNCYTTWICVEAPKIGSRPCSEKWLQDYLLSAYTSHTILGACKSVIRFTINPVKTRQFILLCSTTYFGVKCHCCVEHKNKIKVYYICS